MRLLFIFYEPFRQRVRVPSRLLEPRVSQQLAGRGPGGAIGLHARVDEVAKVRGEGAVGQGGRRALDDEKEQIPKEQTAALLLLWQHAAAAKRAVPATAAAAATAAAGGGFVCGVRVASDGAFPQGDSEGPYV